MTTDTVANGTPGDTWGSTTKTTPKSKSKSQDKPEERSITIDTDVADHLNDIAKRHDKRIRTVVRIAADLVDDYLGDPEPKEDEVAWAKRMLRDRR